MTDEERDRRWAEKMEEAKRRFFQEFPAEYAARRDEPDDFVAIEDFYREFPELRRQEPEA